MAEIVRMVSEDIVVLSDGVPTVVALVDEKLLPAMQAARKHKLAYWAARLEEHRHHPSFNVTSDAMTMEYGFTCSCSGHEQKWMIFVGALKEMVPEARKATMRMFQERFRRDARVYRQGQRAAEKKARALLHRYLTKEQRMELRATKGFTMKSRDGRTYRLTERKGILTEYEGVEYALCVHPVDDIPTLDTLLAQKVLLETDPQHLLSIANIRDAKTGVQFVSAGFLMGDGEPVLKEQNSNEFRERLEAILQRMTNDVVENPREFVEARLA